MNSSLLLNQLNQQFPYRTQYLSIFLSLLSISTFYAPPCPFFVYGPTSTGKSCLFRTIVNFINHSSPSLAAYVSCRSAHSLNLVLTKTVFQWSHNSTSSSIDSFISFINTIPLVIPQHDNRLRWMILDDAHFLIHSCPNFLQLLPHISHLTKRNIVIILISNHDWRKFSQLYSVIPIHFPPYTKSQLVDILTLLNSHHNIHTPFIRILADALVDAVVAYCPNVIELHAGLSSLIPKTINLISNPNSLSSTDISRIFRQLAPDISRFASTLYMGYKSPSSSLTSTNHSFYTRNQFDIDLPISAKYILIASYLASYNPVSLDRQIFTRSIAPNSNISSRLTNKRQRFIKNPKSSSSSSSNPTVSIHLLGPRSFPAERLLAIVHAIANSELEPNTDLLSQIATLISLRYLTKVSGSDVLSSLKCKCNISFDTVTQIAQSLKFDLSQCLADSHM